MLASQAVEVFLYEQERKVKTTMISKEEQYGAAYANETHAKIEDFRVRPPFCPPLREDAKTETRTATTGSAPLAPPPIPKMTPEEFRKIDDELLQHANRVLNQRSEGYGDVDNQLANFDAIAHECGVSPEVVWLVLWSKGLRTIRKLMRGQNVPGENVIDRFADAIDYLRLGKAIFDRRAAMQAAVYGKEENS